MSVHSTLVNEMKAIQLQILSLEETERILAAQYGMVGEIDSMEVFDKAKHHAFAKLGPNCKDDLRIMDRLLFLQLQLAQLQHSYAVSYGNISCENNTGSQTKPTGNQQIQDGAILNPELNYISLPPSEFLYIDNSA
ncbi:hypothetical protein F5146DRAFT_1006084 [Armillaria mellea]|nr:hypothetical protein F5146DRAFT_1006084 [Armillaria mellea]